MSEKIQNSLSSFMKKQMSEKSSKKNLQKKALSLAMQADEKNKNSPLQDKLTEMTEEEKLAIAKNESLAKAANQDQSAMIRKLIFESIAQYTMLIALLVTIALGLIKFAPAVFSFFNGLIYRLFIGSIGH